MTLPNVENQPLEGAGGNQPPVSSGNGNSIAGAPSSSQELLELRKLVETQGKELKGLQSRQDKEKNETQRFMDEIKAHTSKGKSLEEAESIVYAEREAKQKDDLLLRIAQKVGVLDQSSPNATGTSNQVTDEVEKIFAEYNVNPNDPEATAMYALRGADLIKAVSKLAIKRATSNQTDSSEVTSMISTPSQTGGEKELMTEYTKKVSGLRGNVLAISQLQTEYRKKGLKI